MEDETDIVIHWMNYTFTIRVKKCCVSKQKKESKGNVKVFVTVRPLTKSEIKMKSFNTVDCPNNNIQPPKLHKPPPIFLHGVINYDKIIRSINEVAETEQFFTKRMANNFIKITCLTPETSRTLIKHFKETDVYYHTYQIKEERAYRVVLKYLNHTTEIEDIRQDLQQGNVARNKHVHNAAKQVSLNPTEYD